VTAANGSGDVAKAKAAAATGKTGATSRRVGSGRDNQRHHGGMAKALKAWRWRWRRSKS